MTVPPVCPTCERPFVPIPAKASYQRYCSVRCRRREKSRRERRAKVIGPRPCAQCTSIMASPKPSQRFCSDECRNRAHFAKQKAKQHPRFRRLSCHWCSGSHISAACPNRSGTVVKQFGTIDNDRQYVPPPGVKVRVRHLPHHVFGEDLKAQAGGRFGR